MKIGVINTNNGLFMLSLTNLISQNCLILYQENTELYSIASLQTK